MEKIEVKVGTKVKLADGTMGKIIRIHDTRWGPTIVVEMKGGVIRGYRPDDFERGFKEVEIQTNRSVRANPVRRESGGKRRGKKTNPVDINSMNIPDGSDKLYKAFHEADPVGVRKVEFEEPKGPLIKIGRLTRIEYSPEGQSRWNKTSFFHESGDLGGKKIKSNAILATDTEGKNLYIVRENNKIPYPKFSKRGILG